MQFGGLSRLILGANIECVLVLCVRYRFMQRLQTVNFDSYEMRKQKLNHKNRASLDFIPGKSPYMFIQIVQTPIRTRKKQTEWQI